MYCRRVVRKASKLEEEQSNGEFDDSLSDNAETSIEDDDKKYH